MLRSSDAHGALPCSAPDLHVTADSVSDTASCTGPVSRMSVCQRAWCDVIKLGQSSPVPQLLCCIM